MLISNIQRFCLNDGPGIRTTFFLMGCPVRCFWCSNPENFEMKKTSYIKDGVIGEYGQYYSDDEIFDILMKDYNFFDNGGGITFSGGECLLQLFRHVPLLKRIKDSGVSITIETSLAVDKKRLLPILDLVDYYYVDLKVFTNKSKIIGYNHKLVLNNLSLLKQMNGSVVFRIPLVKGFNDSIKNLSIISKIIEWFDPIKVEAFQIHNLAKSKYDSLGLSFRESIPFSAKELDSIKGLLGSKCEIISI